MKTLVGSQALKLYIPDVKVHDTDYFSDAQIEGAETFYHPALEQWAWNDVATLDELYTIKVSHAFWELRNDSWVKHMYHITQMQEAKAKFIPELYAILYPIWEERYGKKKANLEATPEEFFNANVKRVYAHDSIHASVAFYEEPLFKSILRDGHDVAVDRMKFEALSHEDKIKLVQEEVFATALERIVIPDPDANLRAAYFWALKMTITSFSKGWFPLFIVLNFTEIRPMPFDYYRKMRDNSHKLILLKESV